MSIRDQLHREIDLMPDDLLQEMLERARDLQVKSMPVPAFSASGEELRTKLAKLAIPGLPVLPPEAYSRESIYEDR